MQRNLALNDVDQRRPGSTPVSGELVSKHIKSLAAVAHKPVNRSVCLHSIRRG